MQTVESVVKLRPFFIKTKSQKFALGDFSMKYLWQIFALTLVFPSPTSLSLPPPHTLSRSCGERSVEGLEPLLGHYLINYYIGHRLEMVDSVSFVMMATCPCNTRPVVTMWVNDAVFLFQAYQLSWTRWFRLLLSKWWQFWLQKRSNVPNREHIIPAV